MMATIMAVSTDRKLVMTARIDEQHSDLAIMAICDTLLRCMEGSSILSIGAVLDFESQLRSLNGLDTPGETGTTKGMQTVKQAACKTVT